MSRLFGRFLTGLLAFATLPAIGPAMADVFQHQGVDRGYRIVGQAERQSPQPAIVFLHGFREPGDVADSPDLEAIRWPQLEKLAMQEGFVVVSPAALKGRWNMGIDLPNITLENGELADDVGFIMKLLDELVASKIVDPERLFLAGISDGGIMTNMIACERFHPFKAAASLIGSMIEKHAKSCRVETPVPMLVLAGTHDRVLPYDGWLFPFGRELSIPEITEFWRLRHDCDGQTSTWLPDRAKRDYTRVRQIDWTGCNTATAVRFLRVEGGAHKVPTLKKDKLFGWGWTGRSHDIETSEEIWRFFTEVQAN